MTNDEKKYPSSVKLGGLWTNRTKNGQEFLSGDLGAFTSIQIWPNKHKRDGKKDPDFFVYISEKQKKESQEEGKTPSSFPSSSAQQVFQKDDLENIPF